LKILYFIDSLKIGGKERQLVELIKGLQKYDNIDCELITMNKRIEFQEISIQNIKIHFLIRKSKKDLAIFFKLYKILKVFNPDIVHTWDSMTSFYLNPFKLFFKFIYINGTIRWAQPKRIIPYMDRLGLKISFFLSDVIVANSKAGKELYAPNIKSIVIYNGFDQNRLYDNIETNELRDKFDIWSKKVVGMVANFTDYKDYNTYINAANIIYQNYKNVIFFAIGNGQGLDKSKALIEKLGLTDNFRIINNETKIEEIIGLFDVAVLSSFSEGMSNAIIEYMALSKPVVATDSGGTSEIVIDQITGFLVKKQNTQSLAEKVIQLLNNPEMARKFGIEGKKRVLKEFSLEKMVNNYLILYERMTKPSK
jgi:glycosyltransferase involved in cell wall biosynthesis